MTIPLADRREFMEWLSAGWRTYDEMSKRLGVEPRQAYNWKRWIEEYFKCKVQSRGALNRPRKYRIVAQQ